jgi:siroheme synthase
VRLKGGDPFIFGRGGEELLELARAGVPVHVVPGITAALGCAAAAGIPLTHRGEALGVSFVTARSRAAAVDVSALPPDEQTWVVYMGMRQLDEVVAGFLERGLGADTPAVIIVDGTRPTQRNVFGTLGTIAPAAASAALPADAPSLLMVGRAVAVGAEAAALRYAPSVPPAGPAGETSASTSREAQRAA